MNRVFLTHAVYDLMILIMCHVCAGIIFTKARSNYPFLTNDVFIDNT